MTFYVLKHTEPVPGESFTRRRTILVSEGTWEETSNPQDYVASGTCVLLGTVEIVGESADELDEVYRSEHP